MLLIKTRFLHCVLRVDAAGGSDAKGQRGNSLSMINEVMVFVLNAALPMIGPAALSPGVSVP